MIIRVRIKIDGKVVLGEAKLIARIAGHWKKSYAVTRVFHFIPFKNLATRDFEIKDKYFSDRCYGSERHLKHERVCKASQNVY